MNIYTIESQDKVYITDLGPNGWTSSWLPDKIINGKPAQRSFHKDWFVLDELPYSIEKNTTVYVNKRFDLNSPETFPNLPLSYPYDDVVEGEEDYEPIFTEEFSKIAALYSCKQDAESVLTPVEFTIVPLATVDLVTGVVPFSYQVSQTHKITESAVKYPVLSQITTPSILLPQTPCSISSKESYEIIRHHVKQNIDLSVAAITSDYDFCFTVKKLIELHEHIEYTVNVNEGYKRRKAKYETRWRKNRQVEVFQMTHKQSNYKGYTPIEGFSANSQPELVEVIDKYLEDLMIKINEPLIECSHCKGYGVLNKNGTPCDN